ncbi:MAG: hypothetical protein AAGU12_14940 [Clostridiales bacterium]
MTGPLLWFRKKEDKPELLRNQQGSLAVEGMLTLPFLLLVLFLCIALIYTVRGALILDNALAATCRELAESSYLLQQATGLGIDEKTLGNLAAAGISRLWANRCLNKYLSEYPEIEQAVEWRQARGPFFAAERAGGVAGVGTGGENDSEDDVILVLCFTPAKLNGITAILPESWEIIFTKRQRAWLTGRSLLPERGLEQAAGRKEQGPLVYITRWGIRYHTGNCRYLVKSKIPAYLNRLASAYGPCQVCRPPSRPPEYLPEAG